MNKKFILCSLLVLSLFCNSKIKANTIVSAPLDSRPISMEYLENLCELEGDLLLAPSKDILDFYSEEIEKQANSKEVRKFIYETVKKHNTKDTTVIINSASYVTNGLIGSRQNKNYKDIDEAFKDLSYLTSTFTNPYYYFNITIPRTLVDFRGSGEVYPQGSYKGLKFFKEGKGLVNYEDLLLEREYVLIKAKCGYALTDWENEFLKEYSNLKENHEEIYRNIYNLFVKSLYIPNMEVVVTVDDYQLPNYYRSLIKQNKGDFIPIDCNSNPIKFSYSFYYQEEMKDYIRKTYGTDFLNEFLTGSNNRVNMIYGTDEVSQLIYARDLSRRKSKGVDYTINYDYSSPCSDIAIGIYDNNTLNNIFTNGANFVNHNQIKEKDFTFFINRYADTVCEKKNELAYEISKGGNIGLLEMYSMDNIAQGSNDLFTLLSSDGLLQNLKVYNSWNTYANTINLGLAQSQVYMLVDKKDKEDKNTKLLIQNVLEGGVYAGQLKGSFNKKDYDINRYYSKVLTDKLSNNLAFSSFKEDYNIVASFPWERKFECYIKVIKK